MKIVDILMLTYVRSKDDSNTSVFIFRRYFFAFTGSELLHVWCKQNWPGLAIWYCHDEYHNGSFF